VLRVDELRKLGGTPCSQLRADWGCSIHPERPRICSAYRCLWLQGGLEDDDRPDRLGAVVDLLPAGVSVRLSIQEAEAGAFDRSPRLQQIAAAYRESMPVRVVEAGQVLDADRPYRVLLDQGMEQRVSGETIEAGCPGSRPWCAGSACATAAGDCALIASVSRGARPDGACLAAAMLDAPPRRGVLHAGTRAELWRGRNRHD
jgi:hypothetical protein